MILRIFAVATLSMAFPLVLSWSLARSFEPARAITSAARTSGFVDLALPTVARETRNPMLSSAHAALSESPGVVATDSLEIWVRRPR